MRRIHPGRTQTTKSSNPRTKLGVCGKPFGYLIGLLFLFILVSQDSTHQFVKVHLFMEILQRIKTKANIGQE